MTQPNQTYEEYIAEYVADCIRDLERMPNKKDRCTIARTERDCIDPLREDTPDQQEYRRVMAIVCERMGC